MEIKAITNTYICRDGYKQIVDTYKLQNGKRVEILTEYKNGVKETSLQCLFDNAGNWIKSKLKCFDANGNLTKIFKNCRK